MCVQQISWLNALEQFGLNFQGRFARRQAAAVADSEDVRINSHGRLAKCDIQNNVCSFSPNSRQSLKKLPLTWHLPAVLLYQYFASL